MTCDGYQAMINRLLDGEVQPGASAGLFAHLASCSECQAFYHRLQALSASFDRIAERALGVGGGENHPPRFHRKAGPMWKRRVALRLPVLALLVLAAAAGIFFSFSRQIQPRTTETVYVTRFPAVVITEDMNHVD